MKKLIFLLAIIISSSILKAQSPISIGLNSGLNYYFNSSYSVYYDDYAVKPNITINADLGLKLSEKSRFRFELGYGLISTARNWNIVDPSDYSPVKSVLKAYFFNINIRFEYKFLKISKLDVYASPALKTQYSLGAYEYTSLQKGTDVTSKYLDRNYPNKVAAGSLGLLFKYNLTNNISITLMPEYTYYFKNYYSQCSGTLQSFATKLGVEWKF
jgi:hypothetical protein